MADLTASLFPMAKTQPSIDDGIVVNCRTSLSALPEEVSGSILYPTDSDISSMDSSESAIPLFGGSIIKLPAPTGVEAGDSMSPETRERIARLVSTMQAEVNAAFAEIPEEIVADSATGNVNVEDSIYKAKAAFNKGLFEIAKTGRTSEIKNLCNLYIVESLYSNLSADSPDSRGNRVAELVYIPIEVINSGAEKFAEVFGEIRGITGTTYEDLGKYGNVANISANTDGATIELKEEDTGDSDDAVVDIAGMGIDVIALILSYLGVLNQTRTPMTLEDIACITAPEVCEEAARLKAEAEAALTRLGIDPSSLTDPNFAAAVMAYAETLEDAMIKELLLEFFPIYNVSERQVVDSKDSPVKAGFFTIYDDYIYIKMPDLSCMDSAGFLGDVYVDSNGEKYRYLFFEYVLAGQILRFGFDYQPPPSASLEDSFLDYPEESALELSLSGYLSNVSQVYLSPVVGLSAETKVSGFKTEVESEIELFSFPPVSRPIINHKKAESMYESTDRSAPLEVSINQAMTSDSGAVSISSLFEASIENGQLALKSQDSGLGLFDAISDVASAVDEVSDIAAGEIPDPDEEDDEEATGVAATAEGLGDAAEDASKKYIDLDMLGFPLSVKPSTIETLSYLIGDMNRPELMLSDVSGNPEDNVEDGGTSRNNRRFYKSKYHHSSEIRLALRPRLYDANNLPITGPRNSGELDDNGNYKVEFDSSSFQFFKTKSLKFAVYVSDNLGQITRVADKYLTLEGAIPATSSISPNGYDNNPVTRSDTISFSIEGTGLSSVEEVRFKSIDNPENPYISISKSEHGSGAIFDFTTTDERLDVKVNDPFTRAWLNKSIPVGQYTVHVYDGSVESDDGTVFAMSAPGTFPGPPFPGNRIKLKYNTIRPKGFRTKCIEAMPILGNGLSTFLKLKAKKPIFDESQTLYAYLAAPNTDDNVDAFTAFSFEDQLYTVKVQTSKDNGDDKEELVVASNILWKFGTPQFKPNPLAFFGKKKNALFSFPGSDYRNYNFSPLLNLEKCYLLFVANDKIEDMEGIVVGTAAELADKTYSVVQIGAPDKTNPKPAFISPPYITGIFAKMSSTRYLKTVKDVPDAAAEKMADLFDVANIDSFEYSAISGGQKIAKMAIIFKAMKQRVLLKKDFSFYIGTKKIPKGCVVSVKRYTGNNKHDELIAVLKNIDIEERGHLNIYVSRTDSKFLTEVFGLTAPTEYTSEYLHKHITTGDISIGGPQEGEWTGEISDDDTNSLVIGSSNDDSWSGPIPPWAASIQDESEIPHAARMFTELGLPIDKSHYSYDEEIKVQYQLLRGIGITPTYDFEMDYAEGGAAAASPGTIGSHTETEDITRLGLMSLSIPAGASFTTADYFKNEDGSKAKAFLRLAISNHSAGSFDQVEIIRVRSAIDEIISVEASPTDASHVPIARGQIDIVISGSQEATKNVEVKTDGYPSEIIARRRIDRTETLTVQIPEPVIARVQNEEDEPCVEIVVTTDNGEPVRARRGLGFDLSANPGATGIGQPGGLRPPECCDLPPINFTSIKLKFPIIPPHLARAICDFSWHLTAELQLHLNNFKVLLIPIQVLLCIIDVICAMMNPWKMVLAIIRLFQCLYDLLLLLPQLSVPIMFLNLLLHLLDIIICIIEKILMIIKTINALVNAIKEAVEEKSWKSILILEEAISEHFLEINTDLDFLGPIVQILALFLELLQLVFRFPCAINSGAVEGFICGIDGTLLAGMVRGKAMADGIVNKDYVLPVAQAYPRATDYSMWYEGLSGDCYLMADILSFLFTGDGLAITEPYNPSGPSNSSSTYGANEDFDGTKITLHEDGTFISNMVIDDTSNLAVQRLTDDPEEVGVYRGDEDGVTSGSYPKAISFVASCTKSVRNTGNPIFGGGNLQEVTFEFNSAAEPFCVDLIPIIPLNAISISKYCDKEGPADYPFMLFDRDSYANGELTLSKSNSSFISPLDGYQFLNSDGDVKDLEVTFEWTDWELSETGEVTEVPRSEVKTFDGIPSMVIMDETGDVYFPTNIHINEGTGAVESIDAKVINKDSASKLSYSKEEMDVSLPGCEEDFLALPAADRQTADGTAVTCDILRDPFDPHHDEAVGLQDAYIAERLTASSDFEPNWKSDKDPTHAVKNVLNFPKLYFIDLRQFQPELQEMCTGPSINEIMMETEDPTDIIQETKDCIEAWIAKTKQQGQDVIDAIKNGEVPAGIDISVYNSNTQELLDCLGTALDDICKIAVSTLTTSFKVLEDEIEEPLPEFVSPDDVDTSILPDFLEADFSGPAITGAQEYAAGIGDMATLMVGQDATIVVTPRDIYDEEIGADFSDKILVEIISDSTGTASLAQYTTEDGIPTTVQKIEDENSYQAILTAGEEGVVKLRAKICDRTIQALSYTALKNDLFEGDEYTGAIVDCVTDEDGEDLEEDTTTNNFNLTKVDRILTVIFTRALTTAKKSEDSALIAKTMPQAFGTSLEN